MSKLRLRKPSPALVISCLALFVALSGTSYAVIKLPKNSVGPAQIKANAVRASEIAKNAVRAQEVRDGSLSAADFAPGQLAAGPPGPPGPAGPSNPNADTLDGLDSTAFLRVTGKAADADRLDGLDSTAFLGVTGKAADADKLDGLDSSAFDRKNQYPRAAISKGMRLGSTVPCVDGDDHCYLIASCDSGDVLATGGAFDIDQGTHLKTSVPSTTGGLSSAYPVAWLVTWHNNSTADTVSVNAFCWRS